MESDLRMCKLSQGIKCIKRAGRRIKIEMNEMFAERIWGKIVSKLRAKEHARCKNGEKYERIRK